jgi:hypothetical protein
MWRSGTGEIGIGYNTLIFLLNTYWLLNYCKKHADQVAKNTH